MSDSIQPNNQSKSDSPLPILALVFAFIFPLVGAILGHVALSQIRQGKINDNNKGLATAGMIVGWVFTGIYILVFGAYLALIASLAAAANSYNY
jgi:nitrate/nitrite transporter NarK